MCTKMHRQRRGTRHDMAEASTTTTSPFISLRIRGLACATVRSSVLLSVYIRVDISVGVYLSCSLHGV